MLQNYTRTSVPKRRKKDKDNLGKKTVTVIVQIHNYNFIH